jgi:hypothetical protein
MKRAVVLAVLLLAGCTSENHRVETRNGVTHYGLDNQPNQVLAGEGALMPGSLDSRELPTGQFTGRERTLDQIGQYPTLPREADARELKHD